MTDGEKGFWQTVPGMITATAALLTAIAGLLTVLAQIGLLGTEEPTGAAPPEAGATSSSTAGEDADPAGGADPVAPEESGTPWEKSEATLVRADGSSVAVEASSVTFLCGTADVLLANGQAISTDRVRSIRLGVVNENALTADSVVVLLDGTRLEEPIRGCAVTATNQLGDVRIDFDELRSIEFHR